MAVALGLAAVAFLGGRYIYANYGDYRPLALAHVPQTMRYRARVDLEDARRVPALRPLVDALDPRGERRAALARKLGAGWQRAAREAAFGVGPGPSDFVLVLGLQLQAGTSLHPAGALCEIMAEEGLRGEETPRGCLLRDGGLLSSTPDGALVLASRAELVRGLLERPEIGDRLGFSGPSVRGVAPEVGELEREARALASLLAARSR